MDKKSFWHQDVFANTKNKIILVCLLGVVFIGIAILSWMYQTGKLGINADTTSYYKLDTGTRVCDGSYLGVKYNEIQRVTITPSGASGGYNFPTLSCSTDSTFTTAGQAACKKIFNISDYDSTYSGTSRVLSYFFKDGTGFSFSKLAQKIYIRGIYKGTTSGTTYYTNTIYLTPCSSSTATATTTATSTATATSCSNECTPGDSNYPFNIKCTSDNQYSSCQNVNGCYKWTGTYSCGTGYACSNSQGCYSTATATPTYTTATATSTSTTASCTSGALRCNGDIPQKCFSGEWANASTSCALSGQTCQDGVCVDTTTSPTPTTTSTTSTSIPTTTVTGATTTATTTSTATKTAITVSTITTLVSTGGSLWINILIALILTGGVAYFVFRKEIFKEK